MSIRFSVVIPAYNAAATIGACLAALQQQTIDPAHFECIVVDDGSTDDTAAIAAAAGARVLSKPRGRPAAARNAGVAIAQGRLICFTDADCEPQPTWISAITAPLLANPGLVASKGAYRTRQTRVVARFVQLEYEEKYARLRHQPRVDFVDTYAAAFRRDVLQANDGFDERFPYCEDRELAYRLAARGYEMVFSPDAQVYHQHSDTYAKYLRKKAINGYWVAQILRRFPAQTVNDSHNPLSQKIQIGLIGLLVATLGGAPLLTPWLGGLVWLAPAGLALLFLASTLPFIRRAWQQDRGVAFAAPLLLATRALGLGLGYAWGLATPPRAMDSSADTISGIAYLCKRALDIAGGLAGALLLPPALLFMALTRRRPLFVRETRIGQKGTPFQRLAFRAGRGSLAALPAVLNVLRGEMSLVGPCAAAPQVAAGYDEHQRRLLTVKPGLTGPTQIQPRPPAPAQRLALELDYIENYSLWRDLTILLRTLPALLRRRR